MLRGALAFSSVFSVFRAGASAAKRSFRIGALQRNRLGEGQPDAIALAVAPAGSRSESVFIAAGAGADAGAPWGTPSLLARLIRSLSPKAIAPNLRAMAWSIAAALAFVVFTGTAEAQSNPVISSITPGTGLPTGGAAVTLYGSFPAPDVTVSFGSISATILASSLTTITVTSPASTHGTVSVTVTDTIGTSNGVPFTFGEPGNLEIVSAKDHSRSDAPGTGNGFVSNAYPAVSANGRYVAFLSDATDLVPGDTFSNGAQVFLRDRMNGTTQLLPGTGGTAASVSISADGRSVVYISPTSNAQVLLYRLDSMGTGSLTLVSHLASSVEIASAAMASSPMISRDGSTIMFASSGTDLVSPYTAGVGNQGYRYDVASGLITLATPMNGTVASGQGISAAATLRAISGDGRWIGFTSNATNALSTSTLGNSKFFLFDSVSGTTRLLTRQSGTTDVRANGFAVNGGGISSDGRYVAFVSGGSNLIPNQSPLVSTNQIYLYDRVGDTITLISHSASDPTMGANLASQLGATSPGLPVISSDGRFVVFGSAATDLLSDFSGGGGGNGGMEFYLYDRLGNLGAGNVTLITHTPESFSVGSYGGVVLGSASVCSDGSRVVFASAAPDLVSGVTDSNLNTNVYAYTTATGALTFVSGTAVDREAGSTIGGSYKPVVSADGTFIAFYSFADDLAANDINGTYADLFGYTGFQVSAQTDQPGSPTVSSITRTTPTTQIMRASTVVFTVTFSEAVTGVDTASFAIVPVDGGTTAAAVASVTGGPVVYEVAVNVTGGEGDFRLDVGPTVTTFATDFRLPGALAFDQTGNLYVADEDASAIKKVTSDGVVSTFASGFSGPYGMVCSPAGDLYVTSYNQVKKVTGGGAVSVFASGFNVASALAMDSAGNLYVGNYGNSTVSKVTSGGVVSTFATNIDTPFGLTFDTAGNLCVASRDAGVVSKITVGGVVTTFATGLAGPQQLQFDAAGDLFVAERPADRVARVKPDGTVSTYAANIPLPDGLAFDAAGVLYVSSYYSNNSVRKIAIPLISDLAGNAVLVLPYTLGEVYTYAPNHAPTGIQISSAVLADPAAIGAAAGTLSSTDADGADTHTYSLIHGTGDTDNGSFLIDGDLLRIGASSLAAGYYSIRIQTDDGQGGVYAQDFIIAVGVPQIASITRQAPSGQVIGTDTVVFEVTFSKAVSGVGTAAFSVTPINGSTVTGTVTSISGGPTTYEVSVSLTGGAGDFRLDAVAVLPVASTFASGFAGPSALAFDGQGNLYVANNDDNSVSKVTSDGTVTLFASDLSGPTGLAFDGVGNLYVAANYDNSVSKVASNGTVTLFAQGVNGPSGLAFDGQGNLYVGNQWGNSVRKVTSDGTVTLFASGFNGPTGLAFDNAGNLFVGNQQDNSVSKVTSDGSGSFYTDGFNNPAGLAFDGAGNLYVANNGSITIGKVTRGKVASTFASGIQRPSGLAFDSAGNLYVASQQDGTVIRLVSVAIKDLTGTELTGLPYTSGENYTYVLGANTGPTGLALSHSSVNQSAGADTVVGTFTTTDVNSGDSHTYSLASGTGDTDNISFYLSDSSLLAKTPQSLAIGSHSVRVETNDGNGGTYQKAFTITVVDDLAPPTTIATIAFSHDTGASPTDFITATAAQTISGTTSAAIVSGESVEVSLDNGSTWTTGTTSVGAATWSLAGQTLAGSSTLKVRVTDAAGNHSTAASQAYLIDSTAPTLSIGAPSVTTTSAGPVTFTVTYADANLNAITLTVGNISLNATGSATASIGVAGTGSTRTVTLSGITGTGTLGISIAASTANDIAGNLALASSASSAFTVAPLPPVPAVTAISPATGPTAGGTLVTLIGTSFTGATAVTFGASNGASVTVVSDTSITVTSPAGSAGTVDITVTNPGGTSATSASDYYTYFSPPAVSAGHSATYTEAGSATPIDASLTIATSGNSTLAGAKVSVSAGFLARDTLNFVDQNGITASYNSETGVLTLTGSASRANYQAALRSITFSSTSHNPTNAGANLSRAITWVVNDGTTDSSPVTSTVTVTAVNDVPSFFGANTTLDLNQDASATSIVSILHASDPDGSQTLTWSQYSAPSHGSLSFSSATASTPGADITPGGTITYTPTSGYAGSDSFVVQVGDGTATATRTITVNVNPPFIYTTSDNSISITGYSTIPADGVVVIPDTIDGNPVTSIADHAFDNCASLISVTIPDSVTSIGESAFANCSNLTHVTIGSSVTGIGDRAFDHCTSLTSVTIPNSVTNIGESAFDSCSNLTSVTIGSNVISIGNYAFVRCTSLTNITLPNSITSIGESVFDSCSNLTSVTIGNSVISIGNYAFVRCTSLTSVIIPNSVISIGISAFEDCSSLSSVTIGSSVTSIGSFAFVRCTSLTSATIPNSVTSIGASAFEDCPSLVGPPADSVDVPANGTYVAGQNLDITVHYLETTFVTGTPSIGLTIGSTARAADYLSGSGTQNILFRYTAQTGESDTNGITADAVVTLNGGTIKNLAGVDATLTFSAPATTGVFVDAAAPQLTSIVRKTPSVQVARTNSFVFTVTFSEATTNVHPSLFVVTPINGSTTTGTVTAITGGPSVYEATVVITSGAGDFRLDVAAPSTTAMTFATGMSAPIGLTIDSAGTLYAANNNTGSVSEVASNGTVTSFASGFSGPQALAIDSAGSLYVAHGFPGGEVSKVASHGATSTFATGFDPSRGLAFDGAGNLYVANFNRNSVSKVTPGGVVSTFATGFNRPSGLAFDAAGNLFVANFGGNSVLMVTPGGAVSVFATGFNSPDGLAFDDAGNLYVTNFMGNSVSKVTPGAVRSTFATGFNMPAGLAFDVSGNLYVANFGADTVSRLLLGTMDDLAGNPLSGLPYTSGESYTYAPNAAPTDIVISSISVNQSGGTNAVVGTLSTTDADNALFTYAPVDGDGATDNASFNISGSTLRANDAASLAAGIGAYSVLIQSDDGSGGTYQKAFTITVVDDLAPTTTVATITLAADTGPSATDFITNTAAQTISGTTSAAILGGEIVEVSLNNGSTWTAATTSVGVATWSLSGQTLTGSNTLKVRVADGAGNHSPAWSQAYLIDSTAPTIAIGAASVTTTSVGPVTFTVTYTDANFNASTLTTGDVTLNATGTANASISVTGAGLTRTITLSSITGTGTLGISIAAGTANDLAGNLAPASGASPTFVVDNTPPAPTVTTVSPAAGPTAGGTVVTVTGTSFTGTTAVTFGAISGTMVTVSSDTSITVAAPASAAGTVDITVTNAAGASATHAGDQFTYLSPPAVTAGNSVTYTEAGSAMAIEPGLTLANPGGSPLASARVSISSGFLAGDTLSFVDQNGISASYNSATGVLTLTGSATRASYQAALRSITFSSISHNPTNAGANLSRAITWVVNDGTTDSSPVTSTVTVTAVNDGPTVSGLPTSLSYTEDTSGTLDLSASSFSDPDSATITVTLSLSTGTIGLTNPAGTITAGGNGTGTVVLGGTPAAINAYLSIASNTIYHPAANTNGTPAATLTITANDGGGSGEVSLGTVPLNIAAINDAPVAVTGGGTTVFTAGNNIPSTPVAVASGLSLSDSDNLTLVSARVAITANFQSGEDVLAFTNDGLTMGNIACSYASDTGILTLTSAGATATLAQWVTALSAVTYVNTAVSPNTAPRTISFILNDGTADSLPVTETVSVTAVDQSPTAIALSSSTVSQSGGTNAIVGTLSTTDSDNSSFTYALVDGIGAADNASFSISGSTLLANNAAALAGGSYSILVQTNDGLGGTFRMAFTITVGDDLAPTTLVATITLAADTGPSATDFITNTAAQTISGTTSANLVSGEIVEVSLNNGSTWTAATTSVGVATWSLSGQTLTGSNTLKVRVADGAGNHSPAWSQAYLIDSTAPTIAIGAASVTTTSVGPVTFTVTYTDANFNASTLTTGDVTVNATGTANASISITGAGLTRTITLSSITGTGTLGISIAAGTANDLAGNLAPASGVSPTFVVDNTPPAPTVTAVSPADGPTTGGTLVTITGTNFTGTTAVALGGVAVSSFTVASTTTLTATTGAHAAGAVNGVVTTPGGIGTGTSLYTYVAAPTITSVSSSQGGVAGGTSVTLIGTNFTGATAVEFGANSATSFTVTNATHIAATSPAGSAGVVDVTVTTLGGTTAISASDHFTYIGLPTVTSVSPTSGPIAGDNTVMITGTNFVGVTAIKFGGTNVTGASVIDSTSISATPPAHAAGTVDIIVTAIGGANTASPSDQYTFVAATSVASAAVPANGTYVTSQSLDFTVTYSAAVTVNTTGGTPYLPLTVGASVLRADYSAGSGTATLTFHWSVAPGSLDADGVAVASSITLNGGTIMDSGGNNVPTTGIVFASTAGVLVDGVAPALSSIARVGSIPTHATSLGYTATFAKAVTGVDTSDFVLTTTGNVTGTIASITGSGTTYTVTVDGISGDGTLRLDLKSTGTGIADIPGNAIIAGFTAGQVYTIDHTLPAVTSIVRQGPTAVNSSATSVTYRVTFAEAVTSVDATDFVLTIVAGTPSGTISTVTPVSTAVYDVTVESIAGQGQLRLDLRASGTEIVDLAGNGIGGGFTSGDFYFVGVSNVFDAISLNSGTTRNVSNATTHLVAQRFTTAASAPLSLITVTAALGVITGSPVPVVTIRADNSGTPGATVITTLTNPASLTANTLNVWTSNTLLAANTTYWVAFADSSAAGAYEIKETAATTGGIGAWLTNSDYGYFYGANAATGPQGGALQLAVGATSTPTITSTLVASGTYGAALGGYAVTATNLPTSIGATGLPTGLSLDSATGLISGTPMQSGTFNVTLIATNSSGTGVPSNLVLTIGKATVTVSGVAVVSKVYDRTTTATLNLTGAVLAGGITVDSLTVDGSGVTATFVDRLVGTGKAVSVTGLALGGSAAGNYTLTQPTDLTGTITAKPLTVTGLAVSTKSYDGTTTAALVTTGYAFSEVILSDTVTLVSTQAVSTFSDSAVGTGKIVSVTGLSLAGADAANYTLTQPALTGSIGAALATLSLTNLNQTYDGKPKAIGVSFAGPAVTYTLTYNGSSAVPINAGSYAVAANVTDPNFIGTASGTLVITKASQTIVFDAPTGAAIGATATLSATASSGLAVTFSVVSGSATLSGNNVTVDAAGVVTLRASQAGNDNYAAASVDVIISNAAKLAQTITFGPPVDQASNGEAFVLNASASSGLPVAFAVVSGPALINGSTVTLTGATGTVILRASQSGDAHYAAAADVTQTFTVTAAVTRVYFGKVLTTNATVGDIAASLPTGTATGSIIVIAGGTGGIPTINTTLGFTLNSDGTFSSTITVNTSSVDGPLLTADSMPRIAAAQQTLTVRGSLINGVLQGTIEPLGITFSANVLPTAGGSASAAGFYQSSVLANAGATYSIVGTNNEILVLAQTTTVSTGGLTSLSSTGTFSLSTTTAAGAVTIAGTVDEPATTVSGTVTVGTTTTTYAGLSATTVPTDRLINLSSRNRTGITDSRLIAGFVVVGSTNKTVLIRGAGPALNAFNVSGTSVNPILRLYKDGTLIAENDDWSKAANASEVAAVAERVGAFPFASGSKDAAILTTLAPGAYTAQVVDETGEGVGLAEVYDASVNPQGEYQRLVNISTRGNSGVGDNVLIGGFVVTGNSPKKLLIRGIGPGLTQFGLTGTLADPQLKVYSDKGVLLAQNDNWEAVLAIDSSQVLASGDEVAAAAKASGAFALTSGSKDASLVTTFAPGAYTVHVSGVNGTSGIALVEIYEVSN